MPQFKDILVKGTLRILKKVITSALEVDDLKVTNKINDVPIVDYITRSDIDNELDSESINPIQNKIVKLSLDNNKSDIVDLQTNKVDKSEVYTKTETDHKICKVVCGNTRYGWFKIGETICNDGKNTVGVTLIVNPTYEGSRFNNINRTVNSTIILTIGAKYQKEITDPDLVVGIKNDIVVKPYDIRGTIFNENCVYAHYENETLSIYLKTLFQSQAYVVTAISGYSSYLGEDSKYGWTFYDTNEPVELPTTGVGIYATDVTKAKYDSANNIISDTYVVKEEGKSLISNSEIERLKSVDNYDDTEIKSDIANKVDNDIFVAENMIKYPYAQMFQSRSGVNFTYDDDGMITLNGISNDGSTDIVTTMNLYINFTLKDGQYTLSANSSSSKIGVRLYGHDADGNNTVLKTVYGNNSFVYDTTNDGYSEYSLNLRVLNNYNGTEFVNDTCKPMFEIGNVAHAYQPYKLSRKAIRDDLDKIIKSMN